MNLQTGAFGNPAETETLILFWSKMEELHYPGAGATRKYLEERAETERQGMAMMQALAGANRTPPAGAGPGGPPPEPEGARTEAEEPELLGPGQVRDNLNMMQPG